MFSGSFVRRQKVRYATITLSFQMGPTGLRWYPEDVRGAVLVCVFRIGTLSPLGFEADVHLVERVEHVLQFAGSLSANLGETRNE